VQLAHDALEADDVRHFAVSAARREGAGGGRRAPTRALHGRGVLRADRARVAGQPGAADVRDAETAANEDFDAYDVFLLLNVRAMPAPKIQELAERVRQGRGCFLSLGDQVDADAYNDLFGELLPRKLHLVKTAAHRGQEDAARKAARLAQVMFEHPAFSVFTGEGREGMLEARTYQYFLLAPGDASQVSTLASYDDGRRRCSRRGAARGGWSSTPRRWTAPGPTGPSAPASCRRSSG
jgi:hypothetical protein